MSTVWIQDSETKNCNNSSSITNYMRCLIIKIVATKMTKRACMSAEEVVEALMMVEDQDDDLDEPMMDGSDDDFSILGEDERFDFSDLDDYKCPSSPELDSPISSQGTGQSFPAPDLDPPTPSRSSMPSLPEPGPNHQSPSHSLPETWSSRLTSISIQPFSSATGPTVAVPESPLDVFELFFPDDLVDFIVEESNRYAREAMGDEKYTEWVKVTAANKGFLGFFYPHGHCGTTISR